MRVGDRGEPGDDVVREPVRILIPKALYALCIPSHDNVGQQSQGSGDGLHLLGRPAVPGADGSGLNGSLQAVNRFTLVEQVENAIAELLCSQNNRTDRWTAAAYRGRCRSCESGRLEKRSRIAPERREPDTNHP